MGSGKTPYLYRNWGIYAGSYNHNIYSSFPSYSSGSLHLLFPFFPLLFPSFSPPFTLLLHLKMSLRNAIINLRTDTRKLAFFSFFSHICPWPLSFFVRLNKWRVFPDLLLYFCVLRSARIGYNTA